MDFFDTVKGQNMMEHITITLDEIYEKKKKIEKQNDVLIEQNKEIISLLKKTVKESFLCRIFRCRIFFCKNFHFLRLKKKRVTLVLPERCITAKSFDFAE